MGEWVLGEKDWRFIPSSILSGIGPLPTYFEHCNCQSTKNIFYGRAEAHSPITKSRGDYFTKRFQNYSSFDCLLNQIYLFSNETQLYINKLLFLCLYNLLTFTFYALNFSSLGQRVLRVLFTLSNIFLYQWIQQLVRTTELVNPQPWKKKWFRSELITADRQQTFMFK